MNLINERSVDECLRNTDATITEFKRMLSRFSIHATIDMAPALYFPSDTKPRIKMIVSIKNKETGRETSFPFGLSIIDTNTLLRGADNKKQNVYNSLLYNVLTSVGLDYYCPGTFREFCADWGYDEDSLKALSLHKRCLAQAEKLQSVFEEEDIQKMPR